MTSLNQVREPDEILGSLECTVEGAISNQSTFLAKGEDWKRGWFYNDDLPPRISFQNLAFPIHRRIGQFIWSAMLPAAKQQANKMQFVFLQLAKLQFFGRGNIIWVGGLWRLEASHPVRRFKPILCREIARYLFSQPEDEERWTCVRRYNFAASLKKSRLGPQTAILPINDLFRPIFAQTKTKMFWSFLLAFLNHLVPFETKNSMLKRSLGVFYMSGYQKFLSPII